MRTSPLGGVLSVKGGSDSGAAFVMISIFDRSSGSKSNIAISRSLGTMMMSANRRRRRVTRGARSLRGHQGDAPGRPRQQLLEGTRRPSADAPEILRRELSHMLLHLRAMGIADIEWLDAPPEAAWNAANALLDRLGVSPEMAELPLPPRLAKLIVEAQRLGNSCYAASPEAGENGLNVVTPGSGRSSHGVGNADCASRP